MKHTNGKRVTIGLGIGVLCLILLACEAPAAPATPTTGPIATHEPTATPAPTQSRTPTPSPNHTPTPPSTPTGTPTPTLADDSEYFPELFDGCWHFETADVTFEMQLDQLQGDVHGTFLLIKICVVDNVPSACRIREGSIGGYATMDELELKLRIPEYGDEGTALLTLADDWETLSWQELEYPEIGLADGGTHYLPPTFTLLPCDAQRDDDVQGRHDRSSGRDAQHLHGKWAWGARGCAIGSRNCGPIWPVSGSLDWAPRRSSRCSDLARPVLPASAALAEAARG
jgi:hypothetical protein